jgi:hypothetical protein
MATVIVLGVGWAVLLVLAVALGRSAGTRERRGGFIASTWIAQRLRDKACTRQTR